MKGFAEKVYGIEEKKKKMRLNHAGLRAVDFFNTFNTFKTIKRGTPPLFTGGDVL